MIKIEKTIHCDVCKNKTDYDTRLRKEQHFEQREGHFVHWELNVCGNCMDNSTLTLKEIRDIAIDIKWGLGK